MKWIITLIVLAFSATSFSQLAPPRKVVNFNENSDLKIYGGGSKVVKLNLPSTNDTPIVGPALLLGGASFIVAGLLTPPVMEGGSTTQKKAPIHQMQRILPIVSGSLVFAIGIGFTIGGR